MIKDIDALVCIKNNAAKLYCNVYSTYTDRKPEFVFFGEPYKINFICAISLHL